MRRYKFIIFVFIIILLTACALPGEDRTIPVKTSAATINEQISIPATEPEPSTTLLTTPIPSAFASPTLMLKPDQDIPDVIIDPGEKANSNYTLYEDEKNIYYLWEIKGYVCNLTVINKNDGSFKVISKDCNCFTFFNGKIYYEYTKEDTSGFTAVIKEYDVNTGTNNPIISMEYPICEIACYDDKLYFAREADMGVDLEPYEDFFVAYLDGTHIKRLQEFANTFCLYKDRIFYSGYGGADTIGPLFEYNKDNSKKDYEINSSIYWYFDIGHNKLVFDEVMGNCFTYDINSGDIKVLSDIPYYSALIGQYILYFEHNDDENRLLNAYDFLANKEYTLLDISDLTCETSDTEIHTTGSNIFLCLENRKEIKSEIYMVTIKGGQASLEFIAKLKNDE